jgi:hypothetical protein
MVSNNSDIKNNIGKKWKIRSFFFFTKDQNFTFQFPPGTIRGKIFNKGAIELNGAGIEEGAIIEFKSLILANGHYIERDDLLNIVNSTGFDVVIQYDRVIPVTFDHSF